MIQNRPFSGDSIVGCTGVKGYFIGFRLPGRNLIFLLHILIRIRSFPAVLSVLCHSCSFTCRAVFCISCGGIFATVALLRRFRLLGAVCILRAPSADRLL